MSAGHLLRAHLESVLGVAAVALIGACAGEGPSLGDEACLVVGLDEECPDADAARDLLVGTTTCETPVREVVRTGDFIERRPVTGSGFATYDTAIEQPEVDECCYEAKYKEHKNQGCDIGRPLMHEGQVVTAGLRSGRGWQGRVSPEVAGLSADQRRDLAALWTEVALLEHASVASFGRFALELMAMGAPASLVDAAHRAARDEVQHARLSFALASAYAGRELEPGPLPCTFDHPESLAELAAATVREGCVGETLAVAVAAEQLKGATDEAVRAALQKIVRDESRHAELAWETVRWALAVGGDEVREAVVAAFEQAALPEPSWPDAEVTAHGLVGHEQLLAAVAVAHERVVRPAAAELLGARAA